jgi:hypothetical protein
MLATYSDMDGIACPKIAGGSFVLCGNRIAIGKASVVAEGVTTFVARRLYPAPYFIISRCDTIGGMAKNISEGIGFTGITYIRIDRLPKSIA